MNPALLRQLRGEIGSDVPGLESLTEDEITSLLKIIRKAYQSERKALVASVDETISALPWPFRGPARAILFGGLQ